MADAARKQYRGRLAYDSDSGYFIDPEGVALVKVDGKFYYANEGDASHFETHHEAFAVVDGTANRLVELQLEHGREKAEELMKKDQPHHFTPSSDDPHYEEGAKASDGVTVTHTRIRFSPDHKAVTETSHTDSWGGDK